MPLEKEINKPSLVGGELIGIGVTTKPLFVGGDTS